VRRFPERPCLDFLDRKYAFREVGNLVARAAKGLRTLGVGKGTRVGLFLPNTPYYVICYFAVLKAGGTVVNFNPLGIVNLA
jgi:long-chain acyl-CoA synthetase